MMMMQQNQQKADDERRREDARERAERNAANERVALLAAKGNGPIFNNAQTVGGTAGGGGGGGGGGGAAAAASGSGYGSKPASRPPSQVTYVTVKSSDSCCGVQLTLFLVGFFCVFTWYLGALMGCCCHGRYGNGSEKGFWICNLIFSLLFLAFPIYVVIYSPFDGLFSY
eukprot:scaffold343695_cov33-Prasinocladus_malaysianus.AAC.1